MKFLSFLTILFLLTTTACTNSKEPAKDTLVVALASTPKTLDPRFSTDANGMRIDFLLFNSFVKIGTDLNVAGDAAKKWEVNDNEFTFYLKPNITFSNGRKLSAEDIYFSVKEYQKDNCPFKSAFQAIDRVEVSEKDNTFIVKIKLKKFSAKFLSSDLPVLKLLPKKEILENPEQFAKHPFGSGSFKLANMNSSQIELAANDKNIIAPPKIKKLLFKIIRDDFTRYQKMINGELDVAQSEIPLEKIKNFEKKDSDFTVFKYPGLSFTYLLLNLKDPVIKKFQTRRALAHAINRKEIIEYKLEGYGLPATSILTPSNPFFNKQLETIPFALQKAKKIISQLKSKNIKLILKTSNSQYAIDVGKVLVNQLKQAGVTADLQSFEWGTFYGDITKGNFQMATMRWVGAIDPDIYRIALHSAEVPPGRNRGSYENKRLDTLLEKGLTIKSTEKRIEHYREVQKIVMDELPIIPLWYNQQVAIVNKRVKGYSPAMNGDFTPLIKAFK